MSSDNPLLARLKSEADVRASTQKRLKREGVLNEGMRLQKLQDDTAMNPSPMLGVVPNYHDLSQMLNEMSANDRDYKHEQERAIHLLIPLCNQNSTVAQSLVRQMTPDEVFYFGELSEQFFRYLKTHIGGRSLANATFLSLLRGFLKTTIAERKNQIAQSSSAPASMRSAFQANEEQTDPLSRNLESEFERQQDEYIEATPIKESPVVARATVTVSKDKMVLALYNVQQTADSAVKAAMIEDFNSFGTTKSGKSVNFSKTGLNSTGVANLRLLYEKYCPQPVDVEQSNSKLSGKGLLPRVRGQPRQLRGRGATDVILPGGKYYLVVPMLKKGILECKYTTTNQPKIKQLQVSRATADVIGDIATDTFKGRLYQSLSENEKMDVQYFLSMTNLDDTYEVERDAIDKLYNHFEVLSGQCNAGNNSDKVASELRAITKKLMQYKRIPKAHGLMIIDTLSDRR